MELSFQKSTFGTKTKHKVAVLQNIINIANIINMASCLSANTKLIAAPVTHMITTLYTLIPTYLLSFNAGMLTCLVSHAKKAPNIWNMKKVTAWKIALDSYELSTLGGLKKFGILVSSLISRIDRHYLPLKDLYKRIYTLNKWSFDYFDSTRFPVLWWCLRWKDEAETKEENARLDSCVSHFFFFILYRNYSCSTDIGALT